MQASFLDAPASSATKARVPQLDGLRGIAILLVVYGHFGSQLGKLPLLHQIGYLGFTGVDLFFVLSGFLIGGIVLENGGRPNFLKTFYVRRFMRILPLYFVVLAVYRANFNFNVLPYLAMYQNFYMALSGKLSAPSMIQTWSLAVEEHFYLVLPVLVLATSRKALVAVLVLLLIAPTFLRWVFFLPFFTYHHHLAYFLTPSRMDDLAAGVLLAILARTGADLTAIKIKRAVYFASAAALAVLIASMTLPEVYTLTIGLAASGIFYAGMVFLAVWHRGSLVGMLTGNAVLRYFGQRAYGMYLIHILVFRLCESKLTGTAHASVTAVVALIVTICLAELSWRVLEKPCILLSHRWTYPRQVFDRTVLLPTSRASA